MVLKPAVVHPEDEEKTLKKRLLSEQIQVETYSGKLFVEWDDEAAGIDWLQTHLQSCYEPLLTVDWILDVDVTVKPLYGRQEGAAVDSTDLFRIIPI